MPFKAIMRNLVETIPGARGAIFVDWEGEAVDQYSIDQDVYELKVMGAYKGVILNLIYEAQKSVDSSTEIKTVTVKMDKYSIILAPVKEGYYVALVTTSDTVMSRAAYMMKNSVKDLADNM